ncbi:sugar phosphate isomerase family [Methanosarcina mazei]|nr:hypothetical protein [Methanosarcina mazei]AKB72852.1 hypothetical protein MSMAC_2962 [Methanosarcina mazei C16]KKG16669.1 hypothetical protein DU34_07080 [Methanosarcina mazei]KKG33058.1 hypothetical protein DU49_02020 [Methanosarcina mazei]KKG38652.1 hypothetical protein DU41_04560 [Methanosarcina mazei]KKG41428.1 hypothetical protein DU39_02435 [Methanosarcina mazei]
MIDILHQELTANKQKKICLLIDSGTTTYHLFSEICDKIKKPSDTDDEINPWKDRVFIITNNLPGIQHFINHCRKGSGEYSDLSIKCFLLPGKPLPVYAAVTGPEAIAFMNKARVKQLIKRELKTENDTEYQIISLMSANYIVRHPKEIDSKIIFCPTARGGGKGGHFEIKEEFAKLSDKIYLISPLTKLSFATCECLNKINELTIDEEKIPEDLNEYHDKVKYREIKLTTPELIEKCNFVLTDRKNTDTFGDFAHDILLTLKNSYGENKIHIADYDLGAWIPNGTKNPEYYKIAMEMEIPHENLRNAYYRNKKINDHFIWAHNWMIIDEKCRQGDHM